MKVKHFIVFGLLILILAVGTEVVLGGWLKARLSVLPGFSTWSWFRPEAPVIIHTREEVRVSEGDDLQKAFLGSRNLTCGVYTLADDTLQHVGGCLNVSSDGLVVAPLSLVEGTTTDLRVKYQNGEVVRVESVVKDPVTNLALVKTPAKGLSVARFAMSSRISAGEVVLLSAQAPENDGGYYLPAAITRSEVDGRGVLSSESRVRSLGLVIPQGIVPGQAIFLATGEVAGLVVSAEQTLPASVVDALVKNYFENTGKIVRPEVGFTYEWKATEQEGSYEQFAAVVSIEANSLAAKAGLLPGDRLLEINGLSVKDNGVVAGLNSLVVGRSSELLILRSGQESKLSLPL